MEARPAETAAERPNGPVVAGLLAAGIGALVLGILTTLAAASESFAESLQYNDRVGPLSGKVIWATVAFVASWVGLGVLLRRRYLAWTTFLVAAGVLLALGVLGTFPTFFEAFESE